MSDDRIPEMDRLAATIDHDASRELFDRRRSRRRRHARIGRAAFVVVLICAGIGAWRLADGSDTTGVVADAPTSTASSAPSQPGRLVIDLVDPPGYIEGYDLAVRVTPVGGATSERRLADFVSEEGGPPGFAESSSSTIDVPSGTVVVQAHLTIGPGGGPREPDFVDQFDGGLCSSVEIRVPPSGVATARMDWQTGCLESDDALPPAPSDLLPTRPPDASGIIVSPFPGDTDRRLRLRHSSGQDDNVDGFVLELSQAAVVSGTDGHEVGDVVLVNGTRVDVWTGVCLYSDPAQCEVEAIRIRR